MLEIHGITFEPPPGFAPEETMISLRAARKGAKPAAAPPLDPAAPRPAEPSVIVHSRRARPGATVTGAAGDLVADLAKSIPALRNLSTVPFTFDDGEEGVLVAYDFPMPTREVLRQYHALRLDDGQLTQVTLTAVAAQITPQLADAYLKSLASAQKSKAKR